MALKNQSLMLYGYSVDTTNQFVDFVSVNAGPTLTATVPIGTYSLTAYMAALASAFAAADPANTYTVTANRTIAGNTQNRIIVASSGAFFSILFATGPNAAASAAITMGFLANDYTGATTYTGAVSTGTAVIPLLTGYGWVSPNRWQKAFGNVNVSATGVKEAIVFQIQKFFEVEFQHEPESIIDTVWQPWFQWAIQQQDFEFQADITDPTTLYQCTLEATEEAGDGLGFKMMEMLPEKPGLYQTGKLQFRVTLTASEFT
jgi:hypothetical protein